MTDLEIPIKQKDEEWHKYYMRLERYLLQDHINKRNKILLHMLLFQSSLIISYLLFHKTLHHI